MDPVTLLLEAIRREPGDSLAWLALADGLEEGGQPERAELVRLTRRLLEMKRDARGRRSLETRLRKLLADGVRPCMPELTNSIGMRFVLIPPGVFQMGSAHGERDADGDEMPRHEVEIPRAFWMGVLPVTVAQYKKLSKRSWQFDGEGRPAHGISHVAATRFCNNLSKRAAERKAGRVYRLPTEAEWEYACRAGPTTHFHLGDRITSALADVAGKYDSGPKEGGMFPPNAFGLFDMHGGVYQWCADAFDSTFYRHSPRVSPFVAAPSGGARGGARVLRSACWVDREDACRSASRNQAGQNDSSVYLGLRLCFDEA